jgi:hypothetical protein
MPQDPVITGHALVDTLIEGFVFVAFIVLVLWTFEMTGRRIKARNRKISERLSEGSRSKPSPPGDREDRSDMSMLRVGPPFRLTSYEPRPSRTMSAGFAERFDARVEGGIDAIAKAPAPPFKLR